GDRGPRREGGFREDRGPRRDGGFREDRGPRREGGGGHGGRREGGYGDRGPRREGGFREDRGPRRDGGFREDRGPRRDSGFREERGPRREGGERPARPFSREDRGEREERPAEGTRARYVRDDRDAEAPQRERLPEVAPDITADELDKEVLEELRSLPGDLADLVGRHLVAAERALEEDDPERAHEHTKVARRFAARIGVVREAAGIVAYRAGHFSEALSDLRAARRLTGSEAYLPVMADCERGLGRPERAIDLVRSPEAERLDRAGRIELTIVESGARRDLGQHDAAVITLQRLPELRDPQARPWSARLAFAYADALAGAGHTDAATDWFGRALAFDEDGETDAAERYAELTGAVIEDVEEEFDHEDELADAGADADGAVEGAAPDRGVTAVDEEADDDSAAIAEVDDLLDGEPETSEAQRREGDVLAESDRGPRADDVLDRGAETAEEPSEEPSESQPEANQSADVPDEEAAAEAGREDAAASDSADVPDVPDDSVAGDLDVPEASGAGEVESAEPGAGDTGGAGESEADAAGAVAQAEVPSITPSFIEPDFGDALDEDEPAKKRSKSEE
ncbi:MAG TPA: hypothetical protein VFV66_33310, partial [Nonomuraea sp.]|nr:hypothetical protein [Nonomuraea sp.]